MQTWISIALTTGLALSLGVAGQASATSRADLASLEGPTGARTCVDPQSCLRPTENDILRLAIVVSTDLHWDHDDEDELDIVSTTQRGSLVFATPNPTRLPDTLPLADYTVSASQFGALDGTPGNPGFFIEHDAYSTSITAPYLASMSVGVLGLVLTGRTRRKS